LKELKFRKFEALKILSDFFFPAKLGRGIKIETMDSGEYNKKREVIKFSSFKIDEPRNSWHVTLAKLLELFCS
jgi:hypothetical protein